MGSLAQAINDNQQITMYDPIYTISQNKHICMQINWDYNIVISTHDLLAYSDLTLLIT